MATPTSIGAIISPQAVKYAVIAMLHEWLSTTYLNEVESQSGVPVGSGPRPPAPDSYFGGVASASSAESIMRVLVVLAEPAEDALRFGARYVQWFTTNPTRLRGELYPEVVDARYEEGTASGRRRRTIAMPSLPSVTRRSSMARYERRASQGHTTPSGRSKRPATGS